MNKLIKLIKNYQLSWFKSVFLCLGFSGILLTGCSAKDPNANLQKLELGVPKQIHQRLTITVLSYKLLTTETGLPLMPNQSAKGKKYIAIRLLLANPGKHRGVPPSSITEVVSEMSVNAKNMKKPAHIFAAAPSLESMPPNMGSASTPIPPGESTTLWVAASINKEITAPYTFKIITNKGKGVAIDSVINLQ